MEVIARKQKGLLPLFIVFLAVSVLFLGGGVVFFVLGGYSLIPAIILTVLGVAVGAIDGICFLKWKKMPEEIVGVKDEKLQLPTGMYALNEILNVTYWGCFSSSLCLVAFHIFPLLSHSMSRIS